MRISDWSSDVCSSDLAHGLGSLDDMAVNLVHGCLYVARYKRGGDDAQRDDGGKQPAGISQKDVRQGDGCGQDDDGWCGSQAVYCQPQGSGYGRRGNHMTLGQMQKQAQQGTDYGPQKA